MFESRGRKGPRLAASLGPSLLAAILIAAWISLAAAQRVCDCRRLGTNIACPSSNKNCCVQDGNCQAAVSSCPCRDSSQCPSKWCCMKTQKAWEAEELGVCSRTPASPDGARYCSCIDLNGVTYNGPCCNGINKPVKNPETDCPPCTDASECPNGYCCSKTAEAHAQDNDYGDGKGKCKAAAVSAADWCECEYGLNGLKCPSPVGSRSEAKCCANGKFTGQCQDTCPCSTVDDCQNGECCTATPLTGALARDWVAPGNAPAYCYEFNDAGACTGKTATCCGDGRCAANDASCDCADDSDCAEGYACSIKQKCTNQIIVNGKQMVKDCNSLPSSNLKCPGGTDYCCVDGNGDGRCVVAANDCAKTCSVDADCPTKQCCNTLTGLCSTSIMFAGKQVCADCGSAMERGLNCTGTTPVCCPTPEGNRACAAAAANCGGRILGKDVAKYQAFHEMFIYAYANATMALDNGIYYSRDGDNNNENEPDLSDWKDFRIWIGFSASEEHDDCGDGVRGLDFATAPKPLLIAADAAAQFWWEECTALNACAAAAKVDGVSFATFKSWTTLAAQNILAYLQQAPGGRYLLCLEEYFKYGATHNVFKRSADPQEEFFGLVAWSAMLNPVNFFLAGAEKPVSALNLMRKADELQWLVPTPVALMESLIELLISHDHSLPLWTVPLTNATVLSATATPAGAETEGAAVQGPTADGVATDGATTFDGATVEGAAAVEAVWPQVLQPLAGVGQMEEGPRRGEPSGARTLGIAASKPRLSIPEGCSSTDIKCILKSRSNDPAQTEGTDAGAVSFTAESNGASTMAIAADNARLDEIREYLTTERAKLEACQFLSADTGLGAGGNMGGLFQLGTKKNYAHLLRDMTISRASYVADVICGPNQCGALQAFLDTLSKVSTATGGSECASGAAGTQSVLTAGFASPGSVVGTNCLTPAAGLYGNLACDLAKIVVAHLEKAIANPKSCATAVFNGATQVCDCRNLGANIACPSTKSVCCPRGGKCQTAVSSCACSKSSECPASSCCMKSQAAWEAGQLGVCSKNPVSSDGKRFCGCDDLNGVAPLATCCNGINKPAKNPETDCPPCVSGWECPEGYCCSKTAAAHALDEEGEDGFGTCRAAAVSGGGAEWCDCHYDMNGATCPSPVGPQNEAKCGDGRCAATDADCDCGDSSECAIGYACGINKKCTNQIIVNGKQMVKDCNDLPDQNLACPSGTSYCCVDGKCAKSVSSCKCRGNLQCREGTCCSRLPGANVCPDCNDANGAGCPGSRSVCCDDGRCVVAAKDCAKVTPCTEDSDCPTKQCCNTLTGLCSSSIIAADGKQVCADCRDAMKRGLNCTADKPICCAAPVGDRACAATQADCAGKIGGKDVAKYQAFHDMFVSAYANATLPMDDGIYYSAEDIEYNKPDLSDYKDFRYWIKGGDEEHDDCGYGIKGLDFATAAKPLLIAADAAAQFWWEECKALKACVAAAKADGVKLANFKSWTTLAAQKILAYLQQAPGGRHLLCPDDYFEYGATYQVFERSPDAQYGFFGVVAWPTMLNPVNFFFQGAEKPISTLNLMRKAREMKWILPTPIYMMEGLIELLIFHDHSLPLWTVPLTNATVLSATATPAGAATDGATTAGASTEAAGQLLQPLAGVGQMEEGPRRVEASGARAQGASASRRMRGIPQGCASTDIKCILKSRSNDPAQTEGTDAGAVAFTADSNGASTMAIAADNACLEEIREYLEIAKWLSDACQSLSADAGLGAGGNVGGLFELGAKKNYAHLLRDMTISRASYVADVICGPNQCGTLQAFLDTLSKVSTATGGIECASGAAGTQSVLTAGTAVQPGSTGGASCLTPAAGVYGNIACDFAKIVVAHLEKAIGCCAGKCLVNEECAVYNVYDWVLNPSVPPCSGTGGTGAGFPAGPFTPPPGDIGEGWGVY
ncbi:hypothetical protein Rsub_06812 [Raphidocelis subcapitata]|uniref:Uncharacterized protein n=1 Tax=Raphidocelis subcapitata TaxID=307507 RepID=A0A2V0P2A5_9CHLO|nr:hypothetical protein Rsub_06812 [Raphidocelis subcapitata]|eukprot:GBF93709.1 hypothetical protein Rsub_06812 [Raphidocelis subcapitata]